MNWGLLKKIGKVALTGINLVLGYGPTAVKIIPGDKDDRILAAVTPELTQIAAVIQNVEIFGQVLATPGADKLRAATPAVAQVILASSILARHKIGDGALFQLGCGKVADGFADILNSLKEDGVTVTEKA